MALASFEPCRPFSPETKTAAPQHRQQLAATDERRYQVNRDVPQEGPGQVESKHGPREIREDGPELIAQRALVELAAANAGNATAEFVMHARSRHETRTPASPERAQRELDIFVVRKEVLTKQADLSEHSQTQQGSTAADPDQIACASPFTRPGAAKARQRIQRRQELDAAVLHEFGVRIKDDWSLDQTEVGLMRPCQQRSQPVSIGARIVVEQCNPLDVAARQKLAENEVVATGEAEVLRSSPDANRRAKALFEARGLIVFGGVVDDVHLDDDIALLEQ